MTIPWSRMFRNSTSGLALSLSVIAWSAAGLVGPTLAMQPAAAQTRGTVQRVVHGRVEDKAGNGIKGAVVYLKDVHSASVKSSIAGDDGTYRFVQLSTNTDYEVWAQSDDRKSTTHSISSFDSKADITVFLKIDK